MNKYSFALAACLFSLLTASCFDDDSSLATIDVSDIAVSGIEDNYVKTAYVGEHLTISPIIESGYAESDLSYQWLLINSQTGTLDAQGDTIQPTIIGTEKNLDYVVSIPPGDYQVRLYTTARSTGLQNISYTSLTVQTNFSQGFYILKETADGNTELDLLNKDDATSENLLTQLLGAPLKGKPLNLCPNYAMYYINTENDKMETTAALTIASQENQFVILRTTDLSTIFTRSNLKFEPMSSSEQVYGTYQTAMGSTFLFTSAGLYYTSAGGSMFGGSASSGQFGFPTSSWDGASAYYFHDFSSYGAGSVWDAASHSITAYDYGGNAYPLTYIDFSGEDVTQNLTGYDCLHCGFNYLAGAATGVFILRNGADRYLYLIDSGFSGQYLSSRTKLSGHMANASCYSTNGKTASYIYCVDGGKLYACVINSDNLDEVELKPEGIPSSETINFVTNQFWRGTSSGTFDYLIVGTQSGSKYKLYMYQTNGGAPTGKPVKTVEGTGSVSKVRYMHPSFQSTYWMFGYHCFNIND